MTSKGDVQRPHTFLHRDPEHAKTTHARWVQLQSRVIGSDDYLDEWYDQQCGICRWWLPIAGVFGEDYGVCSNPASAFDARARFEHDGCDEHDSAGEWLIP